MQNSNPQLFPGDSPVTADIVILPSLAGMAEELLGRIGLSDKQLLLVCDANTHAALGARLIKELAALSPRLVMLEGHVHADEAALSLIHAQDADALIAVGSGTISDLCKYRSFTHGKPYAVFPTAPSMNGYLSANASMTLDGVKESRAAHLPKGVFCDLDIIGAAPKRLLQSGLGDSLCRPTAQGDWLLSHLVLGTRYSALPFDMLKPYETELFAHADKLVAGDGAMVELLMRTLLISGAGMTLMGGSHPASQGEHMIAHTMEMKYGEALPQTWHGEQIGVATLTMAALQQELLSQPLRLPPCPLWEGELAAYFGRKKAQLMAEGPARKYALYERYDEIIAKLASEEKRIRDAIGEVVLPEARLRGVLQKAGAHVSAAGLGWDENDYASAVTHARFTRDKFTFLDLKR